MQNQIGGRFTGPELGKIITQLGSNIPVACINRNTGLGPCLRPGGQPG